MTTPSGQIALSDVNVELSRSATQYIEMNDQAVRNLSGNGSGNGAYIDMNQLRGRSSYVPTTFQTWLHSNGGFGGNDYIMGYSAPLFYGSLDSYYYRGVYISGIYETGGWVYVALQASVPQNFFNRMSIEGYSDYWWNGAASFSQGSTSIWGWNYSSGGRLQVGTDSLITIREVG